MYVKLCWWSKLTMRANVIMNCEAAVTADLTVHSINLIGDLLCEESLDLSKVMKSFFIIFVPSFVVFMGSRINVLSNPSHKVGLMPQ